MFYTLAVIKIQLVKCGKNSLFDFVLINLSRMTHESKLITIKMGDNTSNPIGYRHGLLGIRSVHIMLEFH